MQLMLDEVAAWMPVGAVSSLVSQLNAKRINRLPQMWELAWLYALAKTTPVEHERELSNGKPDACFSLSIDGTTVPVVAEITTISDASLDNANPFDRLSDAMHQQARKAGLQGGGFYIAVAHAEERVGKARRVRLLIPTGPKLEQLVKKLLKPFATKVASDPTRKHTLEVDEPGAKFTIEYKGPNQSSGGSYRTYDGALSVENNALFNRLRDKTRQLRGAPDGAIRVVIVCDGDCALLARDHLLEGYSAQQIAERFLQGSQTVDLVLLVTVREERGIGVVWNPKRTLRCWLAAANSGRPPHLTDSAIMAIKSVLEAALLHFPTPIATPSNAFRRNLVLEAGTSMEGAYRIRGNRIRISARALLELMAGAMTFERFSEVHGWKAGEINIFKLRLEAGQLFTAAKVEQLNIEQDDDWIEFEFGTADPAVSDFSVK